MGVAKDQGVILRKGPVLGRESLETLLNILTQECTDQRVDLTILHLQAGPPLASHLADPLHATQITDHLQVEIPPPLKRKIQ